MLTVDLRQRTSGGSVVVGVSLTQTWKNDVQQASNPTVLHQRPLDGGRVKVVFARWRRSTRKEKLNRNAPQALQKLGPRVCGWANNIMEHGQCLGTAVEVSEGGIEMQLERVTPRRYLEVLDLTMPKLPPE